METRLTSRELGKTGLCPVTTSCPRASVLSPGYPSSLPSPHKAILIPPTVRPSGFACPFHISSILEN